jgi:hypothetical protein
MGKLLIQLIVIVIYIGKYPRELQTGAPSVFLILGIILFCVTGFVIEKVKPILKEIKYESD